MTSGATIPPNSVRYDVFADETESDQYGNRSTDYTNEDEHRTETKE